MKYIKVKRKKCPYCKTKIFIYRHWCTNCKRKLGFYNAKYYWKDPERSDFKRFKSVRKHFTIEDLKGELEKKEALLIKFRNFINRIIKEKQC